jgi:hypothetical protein
MRSTDCSGRHVQATVCAEKERVVLLQHDGRRVAEPFTSKIDTAIAKIVVAPLRKNP